MAEKLAEDGFSPEEVSKKLATCDVAVRYHLTHAVALLALSAAPNTWSPKRRGLAAVFFVLGLGMFCGTLYAQSILGLKGFNLVVPLGGLCFILGWLTVALSSWTQPRSPIE